MKLGLTNEQKALGEILKASMKLKGKPDSERVKQYLADVKKAVDKWYNAKD